MVNGRLKGKSGEREFAVVLGAWVAEAHAAAPALGPPPRVERNLAQARGGGYDLVGVPWLALEVKRRESVSLGPWWEQTVRQAGPGQEPCLVWRVSRRPWRGRVAGLVGTARPGPVQSLWCTGELVLDLELDQLKKWFQSRYITQALHELTKVGASGVEDS